MDVLSLWIFKDQKLLTGCNSVDRLSQSLRFRLTVNITQVTERFDILRWAQMIVYTVGDSKLAKEE